MQRQNTGALTIRLLHGNITEHGRAGTALLEIAPGRPFRHAVNDRCLPRSVEIPLPEIGSKDLVHIHVCTA
jgi:hypothetical protein